MRSHDRAALPLLWRERGAVPDYLVAGGYPLTPGEIVFARGDALSRKGRGHINARPC
jgi:hypothetical protein